MDSIASFGRDFGELVKVRRRERGLTRDALAAAAFGGVGSVRRVEEIEEGQVANPAARIVDALCHALGIDRSDLPVRDLEGAAGQTAPQMMLNRALRGLGSADPAARLAATRLKTVAWRASRIRLAAAAREHAALREAIHTAQSEVDRGYFDRAESLLAEAEMRAGRGPGRIALRRERGEIALLAGEPDRAAQLIDAAAGFLNPYAPDSAATLRHAAAGALYRHGRLFGAGGAAAIPLLRSNLDHWRKDRHAEAWAKTRNNLANALHDFALTRRGGEAAPILEEAVDFYRAALMVYTAKSHPERWSTTQGNLATALGNLARRKRGKEASRLHVEAADAYRASLTTRSRGAKPAAWAAAQAQLGLALGAAAMTAPGKSREKMLREAAAAAEAALVVYSREATPDHWAAASNNLGNTLRAQAAAGGGAAALAQAVAAYRDALGALERDGGAEDQRRAAIRCNLAVALVELAERAPREQAAALAAEAAASARAACATRNPTGAPEVWSASLRALVAALTMEARSSDGPGAARAGSEAAAHCRQALGRENAGSVGPAEIQLALARALEAEAAATLSPETARKRRAEARAAYAAAIARMDRNSPLAKAATAARRRLAA